jgi:ATP-dependent DNA helicase HFM1/MER3
VNSEIGLGTIIDIESAKEWLRSSFLFRRLQRNPKHYAIGKGEQQTWQERLDEMVMESVRLLTEGQLVKHEKDYDQLSLTEFGDIMSKVCCPILFLVCCMHSCF